VLKKEEGTIECVGGILNSLSTHEILQKNSIHLNMILQEGGDNVKYDVVLLFYRVVGRVDIVDLCTILQKLRGKKVILICMHYTFELMGEVRSEEFVVENTKHDVHRIVDMVFKDTMLYRCAQNTSAINDIAQMLSG